MYAALKVMGIIKKELPKHWEDGFKWDHSINMSSDCESPLDARLRLRPKDNKGPTFSGFGESSFSEDGSATADADWLPAKDMLLFHTCTPIDNFAVYTDKTNQCCCEGRGECCCLSGEQCCLLGRQPQLCSSTRRVCQLGFFCLSIGLNRKYNNHIKLQCRVANCVFNCKSNQPDSHRYKNSTNHALTCAQYHPHTPN